MLQKIRYYVCDFLRHRTLIPESWREGERHFSCLCGQNGQEGDTFGGSDIRYASYYPKWFRKRF